MIGSAAVTGLPSVIAPLQDPVLSLELDVVVNLA
jgi:hypothetical protein